MSRKTNLCSHKGVTCVHKNITCSQKRIISVLKDKSHVGSAALDATEGDARLHKLLDHNDSQINTLILRSLFCLKTRRNRPKSYRDF